MATSFQPLSKKMRREDALEYHSEGRPGKIEVRPTRPSLTRRDVRLAYLPGAAFLCEEIARDPSSSFHYTARGNLVGVVTNGTAVPGLGDVGAAAAKPMQEGLSVLFKRLADIDVFDLEIDTTDPDRFVETVRLLEPTFGGINLKDLSAPAGLDIHAHLSVHLGIPVFHENLYSTAVVAVAALINALDLVEKRVEDVRVVLCGAGTVGTGCARLLLALGVRPEQLLVYDASGLLHPGRDDLSVHQRPFARESSARTLTEGLRGADVFVGASAPGVVTPEMVRSMARFPIVFALANPISKGVILADEVGLGKTIEAGIVLCQYWAERRRRLVVMCPASIRKQWALELAEKFNLPAVVLDARAWSEAKPSMRSE